MASILRGRVAEARRIVRTEYGGSVSGRRSSAIILSACTPLSVAPALGLLDVRAMIVSGGVLRDAIP